MTLYTEEEVVRAIELSDGRSTDEVLAGLRPIELPTDEEIREVIKPFQNEMDDFDLGFRNGVQWLREKIQGGEQ
jgi:hypothetical protein